MSRFRLWIFIGRTDVEAEALTLWPPNSKSRLTGKYYHAGKDWGPEKRETEDEMVGWHHWLNEHDFEQTLGDSEGQGSLLCCSSWGHKESDMTEWLNNKNECSNHQPYLTSWEIRLCPVCSNPLSGWMARVCCSQLTWVCETCFWEDLLNLEFRDITLVVFCVFGHAVWGSKFTELPLDNQGSSGLFISLSVTINNHNYFCDLAQIGPHLFRRRPFSWLLCSFGITSIHLWVPPCFMTQTIFQTHFILFLLQSWPQVSSKAL